MALCVVKRLLDRVVVGMVACVVVSGGCIPFQMRMNTEVGTIVSSPLPLKAAIVLSPATRSYFYELTSACLSGTARFPYGQELTYVAPLAFGQAFGKANLVSAVPSAGDYDVVVELRIAKVTMDVTKCGMTAAPVTASVELTAVLRDVAGQVIWEKTVVSDELASVAPVSSMYRAAFTEYVATVASEALGSSLRNATKEVVSTPQMAKAKPSRQEVMTASQGDEVSQQPSDQRGVRVEGKTPVEYVSGLSGRAWAVVIGIDEYKSAPHLKYATADAKAVADMLKVQGFQVTTLYNEQATRDAIESELGDRLGTRVGEQDRIVIFYAGHGETRTVKGGKTQGFLLPVGGRQDALAQTSISMGRIRELADALPSKQVLFLVDVCYGGIAGTQFRSLPKYTEEYLRVITRERGRQLITAGGPNQEAMEGPEWGHSVFTYYVLEGLEKGLADLNGDGIVPASELYSYLESRVFTAAQMKGHTQRPEIWSLAAEKGEFVFVPKVKK